MIQHKGQTWYRIREVAAILGKTVQQTHADVREGRLRAVRIANVRHVRESDLEGFLAGVEESPRARVGPGA